MTQSSLIPTLQINARPASSRCTFDVWRKAVKSVYDVDPHLESQGAREQMNGWLLHNLVFTEMKFSPQRLRRDSSLAKDSNILSLQIYTKGGCSAVVGDETVEVLPGEVHVFDFSREFFSDVKESDMVGVFIPHSMIGYDPSRDPPHCSFSFESSMGRFLSQMFFSLFEELNGVKESEAKTVAQGFCGLVQKLLVPENRPSTLAQKTRKDRVSDIREYITSNLSDEDLCAEKICSVFHMSRPTLYRAFGPLGGVANYISQRRLDKAYHVLVSGSMGEDRIKYVAERVGFHDPAHFSRLFKKRFSVTPTEVMKRIDINLSNLLPSDTLVLDEQHGELGRWLRRI